MTRVRRRGRPSVPVFDGPTRSQLLSKVAKGMTIGDAAHAIGIDRRLPHYHATHDPQFARALAEAKARGKTARDAKKPHNESRYNNLSCRCPRCTAAASAARTGRRHATATPAAEGEAPPVAAVPAIQETAASSSPTPFSLRGLPSSPGRAAA